ncbi:MAG: quinone oxidoreductase [Sphingomicrobium sp.]
MSNAIVVHQPGGPEALRWEGVEIASPGPSEVLLAQRAAGLNFIDVYHRTGTYPQPLPFIPGVEGAGVVEAVGANVSGFAIGDRVAYAGPIGSYAEARLIDADRLVKLPPDIDFDQAAAMMLQGMTARMLLRSVYVVKPDDTILVHAAAGGVGLVLCQWAAALGARVIGTVSSDAKAELARAHGCHHPIIYTREDFVAETLRITDGAKLPVVYDSVGRDTFLHSFDCLAPRGLMVSFGQSSGAIEPFSPAILAQKGSLFLTRPTLFTYIADPDELQASAAELFDIVKSGAVKIEIHQRFALTNAAEAHRALEERRTTGSTILTL